MSFKVHLTDLPGLPGGAVMTVSGEVGQDAAEEFEATLASLESTKTTIVVDLRPASFVYSGALLSIVRLHKRAVFDGRRVVVVRPTDPVLAKALRVAGLERSVELVDVVAQVGGATGRETEAEIRTTPTRA